ncbi:MAG: BamA/TamA family outer membrane protein, partial [Treponema sp.]|nr:BamA/TamA family outer membrane protein [Treponema sp.]
RDINYDPTKGWFMSQRFAWYGLIPGLEKEFFLRSETKLEGYFTFFDIPITERWHFKLVGAAYSGLSVVLPVPNSLFSNSNKLYIDGMFNGRGWTNIYNSVRGKIMWSNRFELHIPLVPNILGLSGFFDAAVVKKEPHQLFSDLHLEDFYFSFGPGIRFLLPQFPLHLLFATTFKYDGTKVNWNGVFQFVLSFNLTNR